MNKLALFNITITLYLLSKGHQLHHYTITIFVTLWTETRLPIDFFHGKIEPIIKVNALFLDLICQISSGEIKVKCSPIPF